MDSVLTWSKHSQNEILYSSKIGSLFALFALVVDQVTYSKLIVRSIFALNLNKHSYSSGKWSPTAQFKLSFNLLVLSTKQRDEMDITKYASHSVSVN